MIASLPAQDPYLGDQGKATSVSSVPSRRDMAADVWRAGIKALACQPRELANQ